MVSPHLKKIPGATAVVLGIILFALLIHSEGPGRIIAFLILFLTTNLIYYISRKDDPLVSFGIILIMEKKFLYILISLILGFGLGIAARFAFRLSLLPSHFSFVVLLVPLIGITEELIFRGFIQRQVRPSGRIFAMLFATSGHTLYKVAIIASLPEGAEFNLLFLAIWTFTGGFLFSLLRELSGSAIPPAVAHALFDIVLYGGFTLVPFWVWG